MQASWSPEGSASRIDDIIQSLTQRFTRIQSICQPLLNDLVHLQGQISRGTEQYHQCLRLRATLTWLVNDEESLLTRIQHRAVRARYLQAKLLSGVADLAKRSAYELQTLDLHQFIEQVHLEAVTADSNDDRLGEVQVQYVDLRAHIQAQSREWPVGRSSVL